MSGKNINFEDKKVKKSDFRFLISMNDRFTDIFCSIDFESLLVVECLNVLCYSSFIKKNNEINLKLYLNLLIQ